MNKLLALCQSIITDTTPNRAIVRNTRNNSTTVKRSQIPYWKQRGWGKSGNKYYGFYRTKSGSFRGQARVSPSGQIRIYIRNPPKYLRKHSHWECFIKENNGWFFIHNNDNGNFDLSSGILQIEQILTEAFYL